eukprot:2307779-Alexandrium_andersonii.AAC.1
MSGARPLNCPDPGTTQNWSPNPPRDEFCAAVRADAESADEAGRRVYQMLKAFRSILGYWCAREPRKRA